MPINISKKCSAEMLFYIKRSVKFRGTGGSGEERYPPECQELVVGNPLVRQKYRKNISIGKFSILFISFIYFFFFEVFTKRFARMFWKRVGPERDPGPRFLLFKDHGEKKILSPTCGIGGRGGT